MFVETVNPLSDVKPKTKIVCTLGPSTTSNETIKGLIVGGMSVARLNLTHGTLAGHASVVAQVRAISDDLGRSVGVMVDVPGPKYRTGYQNPGVIHLTQGADLTLTSRDIQGNSSLLSVFPPGIHKDALVGGTILIDDGNLSLAVLDIQGDDVICRVDVGGRLTERRGVTTPGKAPALPFLDERAKSGLKFAVEVEADFIALSNVNSAEDIKMARGILNERGPDPYIISKIERAEALENFASILDASDGIMVARGDMGVEVPLAHVPVIQKKLISECNRHGKPVITATQMMESMIKSSTPTRAEVTDVANAVYDGTDAVMLSGETAVGDYPVKAVEVMRDVVLQAEANLPYASMIANKDTAFEEQTDDAIGYDACRTAFQLNASLIVAFTESGATAGRVAKYRPRAPILALTHQERICRRLTLRWGVRPLKVSGLESTEDLFEQGRRYALESGQIVGCGKAILVGGLPLGVPGGTNLLYVMDLSSGMGSDSE